MGETNKMINFMPYDCRYCVQGFKGMVHVSNEANAHGVGLYELRRLDADKIPTWSALNSYNPIFFNGFGHGNASVFTGNWETVVFASWECDILAGRVVYLLSCMTAIDLGPSIIQRGGIAYGGFDISWTWMTNSLEVDPYLDWYAEGFYRSSNEFPNALIQGATVQEAYDRSYAEYTRWIDIWLTERADDLYAADTVGYLLMDRDGLRIYGDLSKTIIEEGGEEEEAMVTFTGQVSAQAQNGEVVTVTITLPDGTTAQVSAFTQIDLSYTVEYSAPMPGNYTAKARIAKDTRYQAAESNEVPFEIPNGEELLPRTITLNVVVG